MLTYRAPPSLGNAASPDRPVLLAFSLPRVNPHMSSAVVSAIHAKEGDALAAGSKLADLTVDLTAIAAQDCPPISHFRVVLRERAWLRRLLVARGDEVVVGAPLAWFSTEPDEPLDAAPAREARISIAGILMPPRAPGDPGT